VLVDHQTAFPVIDQPGKPFAPAASRPRMVWLSLRRTFQSL
jgi:hypothetical protein